MQKHKDNGNPEFHTLTELTLCRHLWN